MLFVCVTQMWAHDAKIDGIYYHLYSEEQIASVTYRAENSHIYFNSYSGYVTIPSTVTYNNKTYNVTSIEESAFRESTYLYSVNIPNSIISIGDMAFDGCSSLTSITIPNSVTSIGENAFYNCSSMTSINVVDDNPSYCSLDGVLFNKKMTLLIQYPIGNIQNEYTIPGSVTSIGDAAFRNCSNLESITFSNRVLIIGEYAFANCSSLTSVTIPQNVKSIKYNAFAYCSGLTSVTIGNSVTSIGESAFERCSSLAFVTIGRSLTSMGKYVFKNCGLKEINAKMETPPSINSNVFEGCGSLSKITCNVPISSFASYADKNVWKEFTLIGVDFYTYTVTFLDWDGKVLSTQEVDEGTTAIAPDTPSREGYIFIGWDVAFDNVTSDLTVTAQYQSTEGLNDLYDDARVSYKILRNGQILILRGEKEYTVTGQEVR